jgi:hypothetical protein
MGRVCRYKYGKTDNSKQGVLDFMRAQFEVLKHEHGKFIFIRDIGHMTGRSVTNDAEYVIERLYLDHAIDDETRIFYEDSGGNIDEILHDGNKFKWFKPGHKGVSL